MAHVDRPLPPYGFAAQFGCLELLEEPAPKGSKKYRWIDAAVSLRNARGCQFLEGGIAHAGGIGLSLLGDCAEDVIVGNDIYDLGGGGITAGVIRNRDTWRWADPLLPGEHKIIASRTTTFTTAASIISARLASSWGRPRKQSWPTI